MIYTITFNPAVDVLVEVDELLLGASSLATKETVRYGGAGIDVSRALRKLGRESTVWGFLAGPIGRAMDESLAAEGLACEFVMLPEGDTRINVRVNGSDGRGDGIGVARSEVAVRAAGPVVDKVSQLGLFGMLQATRDGDMLVVSGDVPGNVSPHAYARIIESQRDKKVPVIVEAEGELMLNALQHHPFLVKPSVADVAELVECSVVDAEGLVQGARLLRELGARNVLVSRGSAGLFMVDEEGVLRESPEGVPLTTDPAAIVAGFVHGYLAGREQGLATDALYDRAFEAACTA